MTYLDLIRDADRKLDKGHITLGEYEQMIEPLKREIQPTVQLEQNGKWIYNSPMTMKSDRCGFAIKDWDWHRFKFCPNCGADMRGGTHEQA